VDWIAGQLVVWAHAVPRVVSAKQIKVLVTNLIGVPLSCL